MQFFSRFNDKCTHIRKEVSSFISQRSEPLQTTDTDATLPAQIHDLTKDSPEPSPPTQPTPKFRTRAVPALIDQDDDEYRIHGSKQERSRDIEPVLSSSPTTAHGNTTRSFRSGRTWDKRQAPSLEERRALGDPEPTPNDAVRIPLPGSDLSSVMPNVKVNGGFLKPMDTITPTPRSHKSAALQHRREKQIPPWSPDKTQTSRKPKTVQNGKRLGRENNHVVPNKRQRLDQFHTDPSVNSIISIDSADDPECPDTSGSVTLLDEFEMLDGPVRQASRMNPSKPFPLQELNTTQVHERDLQGLGQTMQSQANPISGIERRFHVETQRKREHMDKLLASPRNIETDQAHTTTLNLDPQTPAVRSRRAQKQQNNFDDSPDELQSPTTTKQADPARVRIRNVIRKWVSGKNGPPPGSEVLSRVRMDDLSGLSDLPGLRLYKYPMKSVLGIVDADLTEFELVLLPSRQHIWIFQKYSLLEDDAIFDLSLSKVTAVEFAPESTKVVLQLSGNVIKNNRIHLEFSSLKDSVDFEKHILEKSSIKIKGRSAKYMTAVFEKSRSELQDPSRFEPTTRGQTLQSVARTVMPPKERESQMDGRKGARLIDELDSPDPVITISPMKKATLSTRPAAEIDGQRRLTRRSSAQKSVTSPYFGRETTSRSTRANDLSRCDVTTPEGGPREHRPRVSDLIKVKGERLLTFHGPLKKSESLSHGDFERLDEDEFLNDNLISFFLLYLQSRTDPEQLKRMHFFNTFFYSTLTKETKGKANIKYDAVARWTKNVNLFSRDFVIVPVNDNFHWFVMIICNLPALKGQDDQEILLNDEVDEIRSDEHALPDEANGTDALLCPESTRESFQDLSLEDQVKTNNSTQEAKGIKRGRKPIFRAKKYDVRKPVIITLDSLDHNRSVTATQLKKYVASLAADASQSGKPFHVDANSIPGMTAKGIPHQNNFSDCGLYLCMYMEQFMRDPDAFIRNVLQREVGGPRWPQTITSRQLREKLALLINKIYEKQVNNGVDLPLPGLGSILIDMLPAEDEITEIPPPGNDLDLTHDEVVASRLKWEASKNHAQRPARSEVYDTGATNESETGALVILETPDRDVASSIDLHKQQSPAADHEIPVSINSPVRDGAKSIDIPHEVNLASEDKGILELDTPELLAAHLARQRSPAHRDSETTRNFPDQASRDTSSDSVSTDFLSCNASWKVGDSDNKNSRSKLLSKEHGPHTPRPISKHIRSDETNDNDGNEERAGTKRRRIL